MNPLLQQLIDAQRAEIAEYDRRCEELARERATIQEKAKYARAKLEGLEAAAQITKGNVTPQPSLPGVVLTPALPWPLFKPRVTVLLDNAGRKRRPISPEWQKILRFIAEKGGAKTAEVSAFEPELTRKLIASQLRYYRTQGFLTYDVDNAKYLITETGLTACGIQKGEASSAKPSAGSTDVSDLV